MFERIQAALQRLTQASNNAAMCARGSHFLECEIKIGGYVSPCITSVNLGANPTAANRLDLLPIIPGRRVKIDELAIEVTAGVAGSSAWIGIYDSDADGAPANRIAVTAAALETATVGVKTGPIAETTLAPGKRYWLALLTSAGPTLNSILTSALVPIEAPANNKQISVLRRATSAFALGLPEVAPVTAKTSTVASWIRMRVSGF